MRRALLPAFLLLLGSVVLGATVFHEPVANAAQQVVNAFVTNDAAHPVPVQEQRADANGNIKVHEQGTANVNVANSVVPVEDQSSTSLLFQGVMTPINMGGQFQRIDVRGFSKVRIFTRIVDADRNQCQTGADAIRVQVPEGSDTLDLDAFDLDCVGTGVTRLYEVPGRTLQLAVTGFATHHVIVFGRP
jgi:hypothetical protein